MVKCLICNVEVEKAIQLTNHLKKEHLMAYKDYYDAYIKNDSDGKCLTCGKETKFERGEYRQFCCVSCMRKSPLIQAKTMETSIARHGGVGLGSAKIREKAKATCVEKYGVENPFQTEQARQNAHSEESTKKYKATMLERYGVESVLHIQENKDKLIQSSHTAEVEERRVQTHRKHNLEKYGVEYSCQRPDVIQKMVESKLNRRQQFCIDNDCIMLDDAIDLYGTGWLQAGCIELLADKNTKYVRNSDIVTISKYKDEHKKSSFEFNVTEYVKSIYNGKIITNTRQLISPLELDIYIPDMNLAIECNGIYWHSTNSGLSSDYHLRKTELCDKQGIRLIHLFQDEWESNQEICKSIIANALGVYEQKIYARSCTINDVSAADAKEFLLKNHIQGYVNSEYRLGLYYNDELVQLITIGKSRYKTGEYELLRMCTKKNTQVVGGFSKLMTHQPYKVVHSYIDRSKFNGNAYKASKFVVESFTAPSYYYWSVVTGKLNRLACQKHKLPKLLGSTFDSSKTERQNMIDAGFYQLYDSGNIKVVYVK